MELTGIIITVILVAFFSGLEIAFVSANKLRIELLKEKGSTRAKIIANFNKEPARFISAILIGLNIALVIFGSITANFLVPERFGLPHMEEVPLLITQTIITTFFILIFGELIPKILFRVNSDSTLLLFAYPAQLLYWILLPMSLLFHALSRGLIRIISGKNAAETRQSFTEDDLGYLVKETAANEDNEEHETDGLNSEIFEKVLYLKDVKVRSCMVPRLEIIALEQNESIEVLRKKFVDTSLSRIFIFDETIDKILGYAHHYDLLKKPTAIKDILWQPIVVPATMNARDLIAQFIREKKSVAWVVDEYGGTAGIVTLEDVMEEIFGEIQDEHDEESLTEKKISDTEYILAARLEVDYLNEEYGLNIPEGEYETLAGFIVAHNEDIPDEGEQIQTDDFEIKILKASGKKIELVNFKLRTDKD